jgi:hypothetical protein
MQMPSKSSQRGASLTLFLCLDGVALATPSIVLGQGNGNKNNGTGTNSPGQLVITAATVDFGTAVISITGQNFGSTAPEAFLGLLDGQIVDLSFEFLVSPTEVTATLPLGLVPGTYTLIVRGGNGSTRVDSMDITIGAAGPQGDPGFDGADGAEGATGPQGPQGPPGVIPNQLCTPPTVMIGIDANGEIVCSDPPVVPKTKTVFRTSTVFSMNLGGVAAADNICAAHATSAGLSGTFKAWLSDSTSSPLSSFTQSTDPYVLVDGTVVANDWADLTDGTIATGIALDENGVSLKTNVATGTKNNGNPTGVDCQDWTTTAKRELFTNGTSTYTGAPNPWSDARQSSCLQKAALYCFEQ